MKRHRVVLDTNVLVSALRSNKGASYRLLKMVGGQYLEICLSATLLFEYEDAIFRPGMVESLSSHDKNELIEYLAFAAVKQEIYFLWRPFLPDAGDDMVLEVAVASGATHVVTYNLKDFRGIEKFGLKALSPAEMLVLMGGSK